MNTSIANKTGTIIGNSTVSKAEEPSVFSYSRSVADDGRLVLAIDDNLDIVGTLKFCREMLDASSERDKGAIIFYLGEAIHVSAEFKIADIVDTICRTNINRWEQKFYLVNPLHNEQSAYKLEALYKLLKEPILFEDSEGKFHTFTWNMTASDIWEKHGSGPGLKLPPKVSSSDLAVLLVSHLIDKARKEDIIITFTSLGDDHLERSWYTAKFNTDRCTLVVSAFGGITNSREDRGLYIDDLFTNLVLDGIEFTLNGDQAAELFTKLHDTGHTFIRKVTEYGG